MKQFCKNCVVKTCKIDTDAVNKPLYHDNDSCLRKYCSQLGSVTFSLSFPDVSSRPAYPAISETNQENAKITNLNLNPRNKTLQICCNRLKISVETFHDITHKSHFLIIKVIGQLLLLTKSSFPRRKQNGILHNFCPPI